MNRVVRGEDGRRWVVRSNMEWRPPATATDFEHDEGGGHVSGIAMGIVALVLIVVLLAWMPEDVVVPAWVPLALILVVLFFPIRWMLHRPWTVVAETDGDGSDGQDSERWVGTIRGLFSIRGEVNKIAKTIEQQGMPDFEGPLHPVE